MKKNILFIFCLTCLHINFLHAQSFTFPLPNYSVFGTDTLGVLSIVVDITNASNQTLVVDIEKTVNNLAPNHSSLFCFGGLNGTLGSCYDTLDTFSDTLSFAGHSTQPLTADLNTNYTIGTSCVTYRIKDVNNPSDFADIGICYYVTLTGINTVENTSTISLPNPNPADKFTVLSLDLKGNSNDYSIAVFNILGNKIQVNKLTTKSGLLILPTSELNPGVYFYSLLESNKILSTSKLVVNHP